MKKNIHSLSVLLAILAFLFQACTNDYDELEKDPNRPTNVTPGLVLNGVMNSMYESPWSTTQRWNQFSCCNYNYYGTQEYNWTYTSLSFTTLKNVTKMEEEALRSGLPEQNAYAALGKYFRAWFYYRMTMLVGDLPEGESLQPTEIQQPAYDTQQEIFSQVLVWLDEANTDMAALINSGQGAFTGDIFFNNDLRKWQKAVNTFKLRVLTQLSNKEADATLNIKARFSEVLSNKGKYPLMEDMQDNMQYLYNSQFNKYPVNPDNYGFDATRYNYSSTYVGNLSSLRDPRVFIVAEPAGAKLKAGLQPTDYAAFVGASPSQDLGDMSSRAGTDNGSGFLPGEYSFYNRKRYYTSYTAESCIQLGYPELCFNVAEAIHRGWVSGNAEEWYIRGIRASQSFYGIREGANTVYFFKAGGSPSNAADYTSHVVNFDWDSYYSQPAVKYAAGQQGLQQILLQKYLAFFQNSGWEAYFNYRRTGVPDFANGGPGTGNSGRIPKRFQYPPSETTTNGANLSAAISRQFASGKDDINEVMWILK